ncbi:hypothetical protein BABINDRAFT_159477 [Babjeviella inositovora NRRL Y-12698]|uniref:Inheritance of peroxisomes protein 1 n=1 Tax=Babjeviella inositovora NRRL Y-12698 TaxID=984486 RepID=A0A1E3QZ87_9ASCO|nr:uncharacterized protein BABINDRAFT_159477 [Babjeviella inositovora NRRL Y-12698]ODQ82999.1 hypothetical protein BABINDRAFT_159477 [Babjeviella inositovora NRRL Y-12698]
MSSLQTRDLNVAEFDYAYSRKNLKPVTPETASVESLPKPEKLEEIKLTPRSRALARHRSLNGLEEVKENDDSGGIQARIRRYASISLTEEAQVYTRPTRQTSQRSLRLASQLSSPSTEPGTLMESVIRPNRSKIDQMDKRKLAQESNATEKLYLFQSNDAKIMVFHDQLGEDISKATSTKGRLLGHGAFEIYSMHYGSITYLHCGSVIYPLLPRLKILRINYNQFIVPLSNPERYWQITLFTVDEAVIDQLVAVFSKSVKFRNLYFKSGDELEDKAEWEKLRREVAERGNSVRSASENIDRIIDSKRANGLSPDSAMDLGEMPRELDSLCRTTSDSSLNSTIRSATASPVFEELGMIDEIVNPESDTPQAEGLGLILKDGREANSALGFPIDLQHNLDLNFQLNFVANRALSFDLSLGLNRDAFPPIKQPYPPYPNPDDTQLYSQAPLDLHMPAPVPAKTFHEEKTAFLNDFPDLPVLSPIFSPVTAYEISAPLKKTNSASSLDSLLGEFEESFSSNVIPPANPVYGTQHQTSHDTLMHSVSQRPSRRPSMVSNMSLSLRKLEQKHVKEEAGSLASSLYRRESSWMDPNDIEIASYIHEATENSVQYCQLNEANLARQEAHPFEPKVSLSRKTSFESTLNSYRLPYYSHWGPSDEAHNPPRTHRRPRLPSRSNTYEKYEARDDGFRDRGVESPADLRRVQRGIIHSHSADIRSLSKRNLTSLSEHLYPVVSVPRTYDSVPEKSSSARDTLRHQNRPQGLPDYPMSRSRKTSEVGSDYQQRKKDRVRSAVNGSHRFDSQEIFSIVSSRATTPGLISRSASVRDIPLAQQQRKPSFASKLFGW